MLIKLFLHMDNMQINVCIENWYENKNLWMLTKGLRGHLSTRQTLVPNIVTARDACETLMPP